MLTHTTYFTKLNMLNKKSYVYFQMKAVKPA